MANVYEDAYLTQGVNALVALGNRIGLYTSTGARVGTVYADTTWAAAVLSGSGANRVATRTGSEVTITVPASTVTAGTQITHYGVLTGTTLLRKVDLEPVSITVNRADMAFDVRVTPSLAFNPTE
ncbi:hypothetical protein [Gordonia caeni]|uniref:Uncharacterized protein n=1 Tax=Gordonia caeni TaxID=1007097 RepID=A0ABP7PC32_9ACTN